MKNAAFKNHKIHVATADFSETQPLLRGGKKIQTFVFRPLSGVKIMSIAFRNDSKFESARKRRLPNWVETSFRSFS